MHLDKMCSKWRPMICGSLEVVVMVGPQAARGVIASGQPLALISTGEPCSTKKRGACVAPLRHGGRSPRVAVGPARQPCSNWSTLC